MLPLILILCFTVSSSMPVMPIESYESESCICGVGEVPSLMPIMPIENYEVDDCLCVKGEKTGIRQRRSVPSKQKSQKIPSINSIQITKANSEPMKKGEPLIVQNKSKESVEQSTTSKVNDTVKVTLTPKSQDILKKKEEPLKQYLNSTDVHQCSNLGKTFVILYSDDKCSELKSKFDITNIAEFDLYSTDSQEKDSDKYDSVSQEERFKPDRTVISVSPREVGIRDNLDGVDVLRASYGGKCTFGIKTQMCYSVPIRPDPIRKEKGNGCFLIENGATRYHTLNYDSYGSFKIESVKTFKQNVDPIEQVLGPLTSQWSNKGGCFDSFAKNNR